MEKMIRFLFIIWLGILSSSAMADIKMPSFFSDNMVLQRDTDLEIWGWAEAGENIQLTLKGEKFKTRANESGDWSIVIGSHEADGPFDIKLKGNNVIVLQNVLFGDVWICSGQSNMDWSLSGDYYGEKAIAEADYPDMRLFKVGKAQSQSPQKDVKGKWQMCSPVTVGSFSAVAYYFGKEIHLTQEVPVGLIQASWGGSGIVSWMSVDAFDQFPEFKNDIKLLRSEKDYLGIKSDEFQQRLDTWFEAISKNSPLLSKKDRLNTKAIQEVNWTATEVPKKWERTSVGNFDGLVWYKASFDAGEQLMNDTATYLSLGKLDDHDIVFFNGQCIGQASWKEWHRFYFIPDALMKKEKNELVVGIIDYGGEGGFSSDKNDLFIDSFNKAGINARYPLPANWSFYVDSYKPDLRPNWLGGIVEPTILYNGMLAPLANLQVKGAIWYQGERSKASPEGYDKKLKALIRDWRNHWGEELPFFFVQLPNYANEPGQYPEGNWAKLRHLQAQALDLPNTGMAVTYDVGNSHDIHPLHKEPVGYRLALAARKVAYGEPVVYVGPQLEKVIDNGNTITVEFETFNQKLIASDPYGYVRGFHVGFQEEDKIDTIPVKAVIVENEIVISLENVGSPDVLRYAWEDDPDANLYNGSGLPAPPFEYWLK